MPGRSGFIASAVFHLFVVALIFFGLPHFFEDKIPDETPIAVELVNIAPETHATKVTQAPPVPKAKPEEVAQAEPTPPAPPKPEPPKPEPPKPPPPPPPPPPPTPPPPAPPPPVPPPPEPKPPEPKPLPKPPEPKPEPPKPELPKPEPPKPEPPKPLPPRPDPKPVQKPKPDNSDTSFNDMLRNITKQQVAANESTPQAKATPAQQPQHHASSQPIAPLAAQLSTSELDVVTQQIEACWVIQAGARDAKDLQPKFRVTMNQDGTVRGADLLNTDQLGNPFFQAAADSARRALQNKNCQPLKLPPDKYDQWRTFTITFDPKDIQ